MFVHCEATKKMQQSTTSTRKGNRDLAGAGKRDPGGPSGAKGSNSRGTANASHSPVAG